MNAIETIAVQASNVRTTLGNIEVLHGVSLRVPAGRWTSIVGPNGAGKSTLLKVLAGLRLPAMRAGLVAVLALATGTAVAQTGLIAFVGLAAPHLVRSVVKTTHWRLIGLSALMGAALLVAADILARWLIAPQELPVGVLTAVLGGGYLLWLMHRKTGSGGRGAGL